MSDGDLRPSGAAIRASVDRTHRDPDDPVLVVELDGRVGPAEALGDGPSVSGDRAAASVLVDSVPRLVGLRYLGGRRAVLEVEGTAHALLLGPARRRGAEGASTREVVVDGWLVEVETEAAWRAALRDRASRRTVGAAAGGPLEVRASIPGRIVAVSVAEGDEVAADQGVAVLEAMKMQNEIRAGRHGIVERLAVGVGENVEVGDLLLVIR
jgi:biotin carboxyl carrier protein